MYDDALARELEQLGLDRRNWRAVSLLPLIEVAWADGQIQPAERKLLLEAARQHGIEPGDAFLDRWLTRRPPRSEFLHARSLLLRLWRRVGPTEARQPETLEQLLELCLRVAESAGGLFGVLFRIEASEREAMNEIAQSLQLGPELPAPVALAWRRTATPAPNRADGPTRRRPAAPVALQTGPQPTRASEETTQRLTRPPLPPPPDRTPDDDGEDDIDDVTQPFVDAVDLDGLANDALFDEE